MPATPSRRLHSGLFFFVLLILLCLRAPLSLAWNPLPSQPAQAIFYPDLIELTVEEALTPEMLPSGDRGFLFAIPSQAARDSFIVSIGDETAGSYYWLEKKERDSLLAAIKGVPLQEKTVVPANESSPDRKILLHKVVELSEEAARKEGSLKATEARIVFWTALLDSMSKGGWFKDALANVMAGVADVDKTFAETVPSLYQDRDKEIRLLEDVRQRLRKARTDLEDHDRKTEVELVAVRFAGSADSAQPLRYSYTVPGVCERSYRLAAYPAKGTVVIAQDVSLRQNSGFDWENPELFVSSAQWKRTLRPSPVQPWEVLLTVVETTPRSKEVMEAAAPAMIKAQSRGALRDTSEHDSHIPSRPVFEERATFTFWSLGKQRIQTKNEMRLALASDTYKARFYYTLRPMNNPLGYLTAELSLPASLDLPAGMAQFSVDGGLIGQQIFSFHGDKGTVYFGSDPRVTAVMRDLQKTGGEQGFIRVETTRLWHWQFTLKNTRPKPVDVILEDAAPVKRDEAIAIRVTSSPQAEEVTNAPQQGGAALYRWKATLQPGEPLIVDHTIEVSAPQTKGKTLQPGR